MEECSEKFGLTKTLKTHIISDQLGDYFRLTGKTLINCSDEHVEEVHSSYRQFNERHQFKIKDVTLVVLHIKQEKSLKHWNSMNI